MAKYSKTLQLIASKLGLSEEEKVLSKAAEFERLLQMKSTAGSMTDTGKVMICLDLAANMFGAEFDVKMAIKYSGLKSAMYTNFKKVAENLLQLNSDKLTTALLCAALQCSTVQELADRILEEYQKKAKMEVDLSLPQNVCMAVYQACRVSKVKVSKSKMIEKSRLRPAQWTKLDADWTKFVDENFAEVVKKKRGRHPKNAVKDATEEPMEMDVNKKDETLEPEIEPYEDWKRRILKTAYEELKKLQISPKKLKQSTKETKQELVDNTQIEKINSRHVVDSRRSITPRRSPRKTPQKYEPYSSPSKVKGVRLLFPL